MKQNYYVVGIIQAKKQLELFIPGRLNEDNMKLCSKT